MRVVVTGGTGFIGERLVRALAERGDQVVVLSRRAGSSPSAAIVPWSPAEPGGAPWVDELARADAVVHLAGAGILDKRWSEAHLEDARRSRVVPTRRVAEVLAEAAGAPDRARPPVLVSASAVGYYGFLEDDRVCDEAAPCGSDVLARMCHDWEAAAEPAVAAGLRVVKARIGVVLGPEGGALAQMLPAFRGFVGGPLGSGRQFLSWIHADDAVRALLFALDTAGLSGPVNVTAPAPVNMNEFAKTLGRVLGRPALFRVPGFALRALIGAGADVVLTGQNAVPTRLTAAGFTFRFSELEAALRDALASG